MKLFIDTSNSEEIVIGLDNKMYKTDTRVGRSQSLLPFIEKTLKGQGKTVKDLTEIEVATGPGSFTGLRVGVSVAQTLGWALNILVNGKKLSRKNFVEIKY